MVEPSVSLEPGHKLKFVPNIIIFSDPTMTNRISIIHQRTVPLSKSVKMLDVMKIIIGFFGVIHIFFRAENIILIIIQCAKYLLKELNTDQSNTQFVGFSWYLMPILGTGFRFIFCAATFPTISQIQSYPALLYVKRLIE